MLHIPKINNYLKIFTDEQVKEQVLVNTLSLMREEQNFRKVAISVNIFLTTPDEVEKYVQSNSSDNLVHHYNVEI